MINVCVSFRNTVSAARALGRACGCSGLLTGRSRLAHFELTVKKKRFRMSLFWGPDRSGGYGVNRLARASNRLINRRSRWGQIPPVSGASSGRVKRHSRATIAGTKKAPRIRRGSFHLTLAAFFFSSVHMRTGSAGGITCTVDTLPRPFPENTSTVPGFTSRPLPADHRRGTPNAVSRLPLPQGGAGTLPILRG